MKTDIKSLSFEKLSEEMERMGEKPFRAVQIFSWIHEKLVTDFSQMTNLSKALREKLENRFFSSGAGAGTGSGIQAGFHKKISVPSG